MATFVVKVASYSRSQPPTPSGHQASTDEFGLAIHGGYFSRFAHLLGTLLSHGYRLGSPAQLLLALGRT